MKGKKGRVEEIEQSILTSINSLDVEVQLSQNNLATYEEAKTNECFRQQVSLPKKA
ncbi:hypothetical protein H1D32_08280 [Anaerobacillus sp. CMMVII]|uniref:hypothetical protein n=1 Tax=Anaerobacillus sp. CMMVII TaxID=2755588 RepID=UPI0021B7A5B4|nr:hypothetical protein [Anaerobacillus sp. CMMVII]MCT8137755.1 hypothetical protein [Anaerobacillus sp. CMMVII]